MSYNLLSVYKLSKTNNSVVIFYPNYYVFYNQILGKMIDNAKEKNDLYYLDPKKKATP